MGRLWNIISNSGETAVLESKTDRIVVDRPKGPYASSIFISLKPGSAVDYTLVSILISPRKLPE